MKYWITMLIMVFSFTSQAAEITSGTFDDGGSWIQIAGDIEILDDMMFKRKLVDLGDSRTDLIVFLRSSGGDLDTAHTIGRAIRYIGASTAIENRNYCESACVDIFLAGVDRYLEKGNDMSRLGFHSASSYESMIEAGESEQYILDTGQFWAFQTALYYVEMLETSPTKLKHLLSYTIEYLERDNANELVYPNLYDLLKMGIVTETYEH